MILWEITKDERHALYQELEISNGNRQYSFLQSIVSIALSAGRPFLSHTVLKALNFHAITCLHINAGEYRPCGVVVGNYEPPEHFRVQALMDDFIDHVNHLWLRSDAVVLAAFVLWRLNHIHPFVNGNGRTARAACYFVLCVKAGGWIKGDPILPELIRQNREEYVAALKLVDESSKAGPLDLSPLHAVVARLLNQQVSSAPSSVPETPT